MAVSIRPKFNPAAFKTEVEQRIKRIEAALLMRLQLIGERCVANMRSNGTYTDRTANLRNSGGYVILKNGKQVGGEVEGPKDAMDAARKALEESVGKFPRGYVLIVVAGMEYAAAVESKGFDVLTGSSKLAAEQLKKAMADLAKKTERMQ